MYLSPTHARLPHLITLLDSIPGNDAQKARLLGLSLSTMRKYRRSGQAPRPVMLALFWESPYGASVIYSETVNETAVYRRLSNSLELRNARLVQQIATLERELSSSQTGAANTPFFRVG